MSDKNSSGGFVANLMIFGGLGRMCGCADMQMCRRADVQMCGYADVQMCGCADVRMCRSIQ